MTLLLLVMLRCSALRQAGGRVRQRVRLSSTLPHVADEALLRRRDEPYTRAITRSGRRGEWRRAIALLDALERRHKLVSVRAGTAALVACDRAGCGHGLGGAPRWAAARELLGRLLAISYGFLIEIDKEIAPGSPGASSWQFPDNIL